MRKKIFFSFLIMVFFLAWLTPTQAFYLEVPKRVNESLNHLKQSIAQPIVLGESFSEDVNKNPSEQPPRITVPASMAKEIKTCNVNGAEMSGPCENYNSGSGQSSPTQPQYNEKDDEERRGQDEQRQKQDEERQQQDEERQKKDQERWLNDMKRGNKDMERNLTRLSNMFKKAEKEGIVMPQDIKDKLNQANEIINQIKTAQTGEEMQNIDMQELGDLMRDLDEAREVLIDQAQRLKDMKRGLKDITRELGKFEKQVEKLKKQKTLIPDGLSETLKEIKTTVNAIQNAKTWEEAEAAGIEDMRDLWEALDENRRTLEMLSRWPQTLKEVDKQLKQIDKELARAKKSVERTKKKEIDLSELYAEFEDAVNKLKSAKGVALQKIAEGDGEGAFEIIENDFFGQMEDTWEHNKIISTLSDLGRFKSDFKKGLNESYRLMTQLKRKKIDVSELEKLIIYATTRGNEIESLLKAKPMDVDQIIDLLYKVEALRQEFYEKADELTGAGEEMPWEKGPILFQTPTLPDSITKVIPQKVKPTEEKKTETKAEEPSQNEPVKK